VGKETPSDICSDRPLACTNASAVNPALNIASNRSLCSQLVHCLSLRHLVIAHFRARMTYFRSEQNALHLSQRSQFARPFPDRRKIIQLGQVNLYRGFVTQIEEATL
jgi:hypothetical protein